MYALDGNVCVLTKIYVLIVFLIMGMSGYYTVEYLEKKNKATEEITTP